MRHCGRCSPLAASLLRTKRLAGLRFPSACARPEPRRRQPPTSRESPRWPRGEGGVWVRAAVAPERGELGSRLREAADLRVGEASVPRVAPGQVPAARGAPSAGPRCGRSGPARRPGSTGSSTRRGGGPALGGPGAGASACEGRQALPRSGVRAPGRWLEHVAARAWAPDVAWMDGLLGEEEGRGSPGAVLYRGVC